MATPQWNDQPKWERGQFVGVGYLDPASDARARNRQEIERLDRSLRHRLSAWGWFRWGFRWALLFATIVLVGWVLGFK
jgi:hypothetical protein